MNNKFILLLVAVFVFSISIHAQSTTIQFLDQDTDQPISALAFRYGQQSGASDLNGKITLNPEEGQILFLSHLNYGSWQLSPASVQGAIKQGVSYRQSQIMELYPVTVIAIRPGHQPGDKIDLNYQDYMEHDAAAILSQSPGFSSIQKAGNYGFDPVLRGFKYDQLNVVLNGAQSATAACRRDW